jgi:hypothetical protein
MMLAWGEHLTGSPSVVCLGRARVTTDGPLFLPAHATSQEDITVSNTGAWKEFRGCAQKFCEPPQVDGFTATYSGIAGGALDISAVKRGSARRLVNSGSL